MIGWLPYTDKILVKRVEAKNRKSRGGIDLPDDEPWTEKSREGVVVAVADHHDMDLDIGDYIHYRTDVEQVVVNGSEYDIFSHTKVLLVKERNDEDLDDPSDSDEGADADV